MQLTSNFRPSRFSDLNDAPSFSRESYFSTENKAKSPLSPLQGHRTKFETKKSQHTSTQHRETTTVYMPNEMNSPTQIVYTEAPMVNSQMIIGQPQIIRATSPTTSRVHISSPRATMIQGGSRVVIGQTIPLTSTNISTAGSVVPSSTTLTSVSPVVVRPSTFSMHTPTVTHIQTIKESITHQEKTQLQRLQAMNDFLTENYTLVYERLKQLENSRLNMSQQIDKGPPTQPVSCINDTWFMKSLISKVEHSCDLELQSTLAKFRSVNLNVRHFKTSISASTTRYM